MTSKVKNFREWRAEKLGYVYFSRNKDLIINEQNSAKGNLFDYLIDIGKKNHETGRLFGVEVKALDPKKTKSSLNMTKYKQVSFPALYLFFDIVNDEGFYKWIKKPNKEKLVLDTQIDDLLKLNEKSLANVIKEIETWYSYTNRAI